MKLEIFRQNFEKYYNNKFHEYPSSWSRVVPYGQTDMTKLIVDFRNFVDAPKNATSTLTQLRSGRRTESGWIPGSGEDTALFIACKTRNLLILIFNAEWRSSQPTAIWRLKFRISGAIPPQEYRGL